MNARAYVVEGVVRLSSVRGLHSAVRSEVVLVGLEVERRARIPKEEDPLVEEMYWCENSSLPEAEGEELIVRDGREARGRVKMSRVIRSGELD